MAAHDSGKQSGPGRPAAASSSASSTPFRAGRSFVPPPPPAGAAAAGGGGGGGSHLDSKHSTPARLAPGASGAASAASNGGSSGGRSQSFSASQSSQSSQSSLPAAASAAVSSGSQHSSQPSPYSAAAASPAAAAGAGARHDLGPANKRIRTFTPSTTAAAASGSGAASSAAAASAAAAAAHKRSGAPPGGLRTSIMPSPAAAAAASPSPYAYRYPRASPASASAASPAVAAAAGGGGDAESEDPHMMDLNQFELGAGVDKKSAAAAAMSGLAADAEAAERQKAASGPVALLRVAWKNERACPDLLPYEGDCVANVKALVDDQESILEARATGGDAVNWLQMELDRVNFVLASYLRTRLRKIERYALFIAHEPVRYDENDNPLPVMRERMSEPERKFLSGYVDLVEKNMKAGFLAHVPPRLQSLVDRDLKNVSRPNLNQAVFLRVKASPTEDETAPFMWQIAHDLTHTITPGDTLVVAYAPFSMLVPKFVEFL